MRNLLVVFNIEAELVDNSWLSCPLESKPGSDRSYIYMSSSNISEENDEKGGGTRLSQIVIEAEGLGDPGTMLCLRVDTHLIAKNLTTAQIKFLICEILDRIEGEKKTKSIERRLH
jgi:hypothetical protein